MENSLKKKLVYPVRVRASAISHCVRAAAYEAWLNNLDEQGGLDPSQRTDRELESLTLDIGKALEAVIFKWCKLPGAAHFPEDEVEIFIDFPDLKLRLTGHPDGEIPPNWTLEAKTMKGYSFDLMRKEGYHKQYPQYLRQVAIYVVGRGHDGATLMALNKATDGLNYQEFTREELEPHWLEVQKRMVQISKAFKTGRFPVPKGLPGWACKSLYCKYDFCQYHESKTGRKRAIIKAKRRKV